jgi:hypothetical protein
MGAPEQLWIYCATWCTAVQRFTAYSIPKMMGRVPETQIVEMFLLCGASTLSPLLYLLSSPTAIALFAIAQSRCFLSL